ncbi:MAG: hypothetical protein IJ104_01025 [Methanobrevibacter sp.]|nr:hypothetical protein [Methanobrevibacter sp.]MBQ9024953.1 hypothetical protein [Methanobrevibacter sp.]
MGFFDFLKELFSNNKKDAHLITYDLIKTYGEKDQLEVALYDGKTALTDRDVRFNVNGKDYIRKTDSDGVARLNINLGPGEYTPLISFSDDDYNLATAFAHITIKAQKKATRMEGTDVNMIYKDGTQYMCAVYDDVGRVGGTVTITVNNVNYVREIGADGLARLNINLGPGKYPVNSVFSGNDTHLASSVDNIIVVNEPEPEPTPTPEPTPAKLYQYITVQGGGKLGQTNGVRCGPHSLMQCIYRLTGIELSEATLASVCGTTSAGTSHQGLETGLAWFNKKYGYNLKMIWKNKSEMTWDEIQHAINNGALFFHLSYRDKYGHYEVIKSVGDTLTILNSLGSYCSYPAYCGYIENRSKSTQQSYINGISQKSVAILTIN